MSELIDRQAAVDAIDEERKQRHLFNTAEDGLLEARRIINTLTPVQPERTEKRTETHACDLISRKATIDAVNNAFDRETLLAVFVRSIALRAIRDMPTAQPEHKVRFADKDHVWIDGKQYISLPRFQEAVKEAQPKEGHWIPHESPDGGEQYECSECGVLWEFTDGTPEDNEAYFCPKCGIKMKGEQDATD